MWISTDFFLSVAVAMRFWNVETRFGAIGAAKGEQNRNEHGGLQFIDSELPGYRAPSVEDGVSVEHKGHPTGC